jgi:hypothetical protein
MHHTSVAPPASQRDLVLAKSLHYNENSRHDRDKNNSRNFSGTNLRIHHRREHPAKEFWSSNITPELPTIFQELC